MGFAVSPDSYDRFMGRFSRPLAAVFADFAGVARAGSDDGDADDAGPSRAVLDVGCGPGALTAELLERGARVSAVDPSAEFVAAAQQRHPAAAVLEAAAEALPFADEAFDAALAQLVVHFMRDPAAGIAEMTRVTRPGGTVAACVWDHRRGPLALFWQGVASLHRGDGPVPGEAHRAGQHEGDLDRLLRGAGLADVEATALEVEAAFDGFDDWWATFELGVGPAGDHVAGLDQRARQALRAACRALLPGDAPFVVHGVAHAARGTRPAGRAPLRPS